MAGSAADLYIVLDRALDALMAAHVCGIRGILFENDNASTHIATISHGCLRFNFIRVMNSPVRLPDLILIKIVWSAIFRETYQGGRQCFSVSKLQSDVVKTRDIVSVSLHQTLVCLMPRRCRNILEKHGAKPFY